MIGELVRRANSWLNTVTGVGAEARTQFTYRPNQRFDLETLRSLYREDPVVAKIVNAVPESALRGGFKVTFPGAAAASVKLKSQLEDLGALAKIQEAWTWARRDGGALLFVGIDDGRPANLPLDPNAISAVRFLRVIERRWVTTAAFETDGLSQHCGEPAVYRFSYPNGGSALVHRSRCIRFDGVLTDQQSRLEQDGWADSVIVRTFDAVKRYQGAWTSSDALLHTASQAVWGVKDLWSKIASDPLDLWKQRMTLADLTRNMMGSMVIDAEDESFSRVESSILSGLPPTLQTYMLQLSQASGIPVTILMGQSPAGLNATGDSDIRIWYDSVQSERTHYCQPRIERLLRILVRAQQGPTQGAEPAAWTIGWPSLWQLSPKEEGERRQLVATTDVAMIDAGVVTAAEVRASRYGDEWSPETTLQPTTPIATNDAMDLTGAFSVIEKVAARQLSREGGIEAMMAATPGLTRERADAIMGATGITVFSVPDPTSTEELNSLKEKHGALERSNRGLQQYVKRVVQRGRDHGLELGGLTDAPPTELNEGESLEPGDVVTVAK